MVGEDYPDFEEMQEEADDGKLIIGVKSATTGHVVLLMPEDLWEEATGDNDRVIKLYDGTDIDRPIALECGQS